MGTTHMRFSIAVPSTSGDTVQVLNHETKWQKTGVIRLA